MQHSLMQQQVGEPGVGPVRVEVWSQRAEWAMEAGARKVGHPVVVDGSAMIGRFDHGPGTATRIHYIQTRCDVLIH